MCISWPAFLVYFSVSAISFFLLFLRAYPSPFMPYCFQWSLFMFRQPPFAEPNLCQEKNNTDNQAKSISTVRSKIESEWEIDNGSQNRLRNIIGQAHFSVESQIRYSFLELILLIKQHERSNKYNRKCKFLPHIKGSTYRLLN